MRPSPRRWIPSLVALGCLVVTGTALAVFPPPVKDDGKFFTKDGLDRANKKIREIYEKYKKDVVVETQTALSAEQEKQLKEDGNTKYFGKMARERSEALGLNGVFILLLKKPRDLTIHMDPATQKGMFTTADRKKVIDKIVARFREEEFDKGLLDGLDAIDAAFKVNSMSKAK